MRYRALPEARHDILACHLLDHLWRLPSLLQQILDDLLPDVHRGDVLESSRHVLPRSGILAALLCAF
eukprot:4294190-Pyramimonas_sp.AAC.1